MKDFLITLWYASVIIVVYSAIPVFIGLIVIYEPYQICIKEVTIVEYIESVGHKVSTDFIYKTKEGELVQYGELVRLPSTVCVLSRGSFRNRFN